MALSAPIRALLRPSWLHAGLLFGAVTAGVLLTSGHAQAATPGPVVTALSAPVAAVPAAAVAAPVTAGLPAPVAAPSAAILPVVPVATPVAPPGTPVLPSVVLSSVVLPAVVLPAGVAVAKATTTAAVKPLIARVHKTVGVVEHSMALPAVPPLADVAQPVATETAAVVDRFVAGLPLSDLAVATSALQLGTSSVVTRLTHSLAPSATGSITTSARLVDRRAAASPSALLLAVVTNPGMTWPEPIAPTPSAPAPALPVPNSPAGSGAPQALVAVAVYPAATAPPQASRPVRRVRTDGSSAFVVSIVEWPG